MWLPTEPLFEQVLRQLDAGNNLSAEDMRTAILWLLSGEATEEQTEKLLMQLAEKGETVEELAGAAQALRDTMERVERADGPVVDTCGTGGDGSKTFNISTAAALVVAGAGVKVAKHGNRKITSSTGSADVLAELGIDIDAPTKVVSRCLRELGICFCFAPRFHPAMRHVNAVRRSIGRPTIFNRLGPLANPALVEHQVLGVGKAEAQPMMAEALQMLGTRRSVVVRGQDGVDEVSLSAPTDVLLVTPTAIQPLIWQPADFGIETASRDALFADDPASSAACIREVLSGQYGPKRDVVVLNAASALWAAGRAEDLRSCARLATESIDSGRAQMVALRLAQMTTDSNAE